MFTVRRVFPLPHNKVFDESSGRCVSLIDSHAPCNVRTVVSWNTVASVVELTYLHVVVKCESLLDGHGKARCTVIDHNSFLI